MITRIERVDWRHLARDILPILILLLTMVGSVASGLALAGEELAARPLVLTAGVAVLLGWALGTTALADGLTALLAVLVGFSIILIGAGELGPHLVAIPGAVGELTGLALRALLDDAAFTWAPLLDALAALADAVASLVSRLGIWILSHVAGRTASDPLAAALWWGLFVWAIAVWAGWMTRRHRQPLWAALPGGLILVVALFRAAAPIHSLLVFLGSLLLVVALTRREEQVQGWIIQHRAVERTVRSGMAGWALRISLALVILAALVPSVSLKDVIEFFRPVEIVYVWQPDLASAGMPLSRQVGPGVALSQEPVMRARTTELQPDMRDPPRYYWRALTYDQYDGHGWTTTPVESSPFGPGQEIVRQIGPAHRVLQLEVELLGPTTGLVYSAGPLLTVNRDFDVVWRPPGANDVFGGRVEGENYWAQSVVVDASGETLRSAGTDYPGWVRERYLVLPDDVPQRVLGLARDLTATVETPYDRVKAIETYLRSFPYVPNLPPPPQDQDVVDYFLFDLQQGHCDYYATAMVVLSRAAGVPARLVTGYASGTYDPDTGVYVVAQADAHAWAEVYFPGLGWVEFEPTAGRPLPDYAPPSAPLGRPEAEELPAAEGEDDADQRVRPPGIHRRWAGAWLLGGSVVLIALAVLGDMAWAAFDDRRLRGMDEQAAVGLLYRRLWRHGQRLALPVAPGATPHEFEAAFVDAAAELTSEGIGARLLGDLTEDTQRLIEGYVVASYAPHPRLDAIVEWGRATWPRLRHQLWGLRLLQTIRAWRGQ